MGLLFPATEHHFVRTFKRELVDMARGDAAAAFAALEADGSAALAREGFGADMTEYEYQADLRYRGENTNLTVDASQGLDDPRALADVFGREHERTYGYRSDEEAVELVNLRLIARGRSAEARVPDTLSVDERGAVAGGNGRRRREVFFGAGGGPAGNPGDRPGRGR